MRGPRAASALFASDNVQYVIFFAPTALIPLRLMLLRFPTRKRPQIRHTRGKSGQPETKAKSPPFQVVNCSIMAVKLATVRRYEHANEEAARIALSEPVKYPGVIQEWAEMVIQKTPMRLNKHDLQFIQPDTRHAHQMSLG